MRMSIMRIVTHGELFAIEKGWLFKRYRSLNCNQWWDLENSYQWCWGAESRVEKLFKRIKKKVLVQVVKE